MRMRSKLALAALAATVLLSMAVTSASANRLSINERGFRLTWTSLEFTESAFGVTVLCPVTLEGSYHSTTISKIIGALIGYVTKATAFSGGCTGGSATALSEALPWHVTYEGFRGNLPDIRELIQLLRNPRFRLSALGLNCTSETSNPNAIIETGLREGGGAFKPNNVTEDPESVIPCRGALFTLNGHFQGTGHATKLNSTEKILLRLI